MYGVKLHCDYAQGSDGCLGNDFVEVKTITPFKATHSVTVRLDRHFSKLLVVKIDEHYEVSSLLVDRKRLPDTTQDRLRIDWKDLAALQ